MPEVEKDPPTEATASAAPSDDMRAEDQEAATAEAPSPEQEVERLRAELETAQEEAREKLARAQAEFENFRRRAQREREDLAAYANLTLLRDILPVLDNLERALAATGDEGGIKAGVELVVRQFRDVLTRNGLVPIEAAGQPFNPTEHEAVLQEEGDCEVPTVVLELQKGYRMGDRLVRPALVKVARRP